MDFYFAVFQLFWCYQFRELHSSPRYDWSLIQTVGTLKQGTITVCQSCPHSETCSL